MMRLILVLACFLGCGAASAATYTVGPNRDSRLNSSSSSTNYGTRTSLDVTNDEDFERRAVYAFPLPAIPANETIVSVVVRLWVTDSTSSTVTLHRVTDTWAENTVTWNNTAADHIGTASASFVPSTLNAYVSVNITTLALGWYNGTYANNGFMLKRSGSSTAEFTSKEWATASQRPELIVTTALITTPLLTVVKSSTISSDPLNGATNPKNVPGGVVTYTIQTDNTGGGAADNNSTVVTETIPAGMELFVGDVAGGGSGPVSFTNGTPSSGLTYTFANLGDTNDSISFSNNGGSTYSYVPIADANGYDAAVTNLRVNPSGSFAAKTGPGNPNFSLALRMRIK
jgi:trimeric autotransporter adhesin